MIRLKLTVTMLAAFTCMGAAIFIVFDAGLPLPHEDASAAKNRPLVGSAAPRFALRNLSDELVALNPTDGSATILNFWSTTCAPCRREMLEIQRLQNDSPELIRILAINLGESREAVAAWRDELGLTFDHLLDTSLEVARRYQIRGLPTSFLLDEELLVRAIYFGPVTYDQLLVDARRLAHPA